MRIASLFLEITNLCNKSCSYCYNKEDTSAYRKYSMSQDLIYKIIDESYFIGTDTIVLSGGEPTFHPEFYNIVNYIMKNNMYCRINSNAYDQDKLINVSRRFGDRLCFQFTIDGYDKSHDNFRGQGDYQHLLSSIIKIRETGYSGVISVRYNLHSVFLQPSEITKVYNDIGHYVNYIYLSPIICEDEPVISPDDYILISRIIEKINNMEKGQISLFTPPISCTLMHLAESTELSPLIDVFGNTYLCQLSLYNKNFCLGNVTDNDLCDILSNKNIIHTVDRIKKIFVCNKPCILKLFCSGGCKGISIKNGCDGFCELRKKLFINDIKIKNYQCWG